MSRILPILFNTDMVRAILDGRKTVTRRLVKPQPKFKLCYTFAGCDHGTWTYPADKAHEYWGEEYKLPDCITDEDKKIVWNPPYHTDDILYVRETWAQTTDLFGEFPEYIYRADSGVLGGTIWRPSIHMPKEAARIWLKVTDVRIERLQEIDDDGVVAEGLEIGCDFDELWNYTLKKSDLDRYG